MKYLKYFESRKNPQDLMLKYADDIVRVLPLYYNNYSTGSLHNQIDELIWECREADILRGDDEVLTEEVVRQLIEDLTGNFYEIDKLLDVYYDCLPHIKSIDANIEKDIEEIFLEYSDMGEVNVSKDSKFNDDRYSVEIRMKDVLVQINLQEVFGRIKDLGFEHYHIEGAKNGYTEYMTIQFWKPLPKQEE